MTTFSHLTVVAPCPDGGQVFGINKEHFEEKYGDYTPFNVALYVARKCPLYEWAREGPMKVYLTSELTYAADVDTWARPISIFQFTHLQLIRPHWSIPSYHPDAEGYKPEIEWTQDDEAKAWRPLPTEE